MITEAIEAPFEMDTKSTIRPLDQDQVPRPLPFDVNKIEFWGATILYVLSIFMLVSPAAKQGWNPEWGPNSFAFEEHHMRYSYYANYMIPMFFRNSFLYGAYLLLTFYIIPRLVSRRNIALTGSFRIFLEGSSIQCIQCIEEEMRVDLAFERIKFGG